MRLSELAFACYIYASMTDYDATYDAFRDEVGGIPDLGESGHRSALIEWLRSWGCRQFAKEYHERTSDELSAWHEDFSGALPASDMDVWELGGDEHLAAGEAYEDLAGRTASFRKSRDGAMSKVRFGATGAAKIMFALRPRSFSPWDEPIREKLQFHEGRYGYIAFLLRIGEEIAELSEQCGQLGLDLGMLPAMVGREKSTVAKLVDEYYWVTITRKCIPPPEEQLKRWLQWT